MLTKLLVLKDEAHLKIEAAESPEDLQECKLRLLGKKGALTTLLRSLGSADSEERPHLGQKANALREELELAIERKEQSLSDLLKAGQWESERIDVNLPGRLTGLGQKHPLTVILEEIKESYKKYIDFDGNGDWLTRSLLEHVCEDEGIKETDLMIVYQGGHSVT